MDSMYQNSSIAILTDFGYDDPFVGIMKGVILSIAPQVSIVDITHDIPLGDIKRGAFILWQSRNYFPDGTIFLTVVDPGVGTARRGLIVQTGNQILIGPDNGLFSFVLEKDFEAWELENPKYQLPFPGNTFHGRDIFAPAAAYAATGVHGSLFGSPIDEIQKLPRPRLAIKTDRLEGEILHSDRFGNLFTSLGVWKPSERDKFTLEPWIEPGSTISSKISIVKNQVSLLLPDRRRLSWVDTFADIPKGKCGFLIGSSGLVEIAANRTRAVDLLKLSAGDPITLLF